MLIEDARAAGPLSLVLFAAWQPRHYAAAALAELAARIARFTTTRDAAEPLGAAGGAP